MNKWLGVALAVVVVIAAIVIFNHPNKPAVTPTPTPAQKPTFDPKNPNFVMGSVTKVTPTAIDFKSGTSNDSAQISASTKLVKQVKDSKTGLLSVVPAVIGDFKANQQIVVYFTSSPQNGAYTADKIQIISQ